MDSRNFVVSAVLLFSVFLSGSQTQAAVQVLPGWIAQVRSSESLQAKNLETLGVVIERNLSPEMGIVLLKKRNAERGVVTLSKLRESRLFSYVQENHRVTRRAIADPNDPRFTKQWHLASSSGIHIGALDAWSTTTGGQNRDRQEIVAAVVDGGFDLTHPDLQANFWKNTKEIAGNKIDDDGNGYIDDVDGWNGSTHDGVLASEDHGTHVSGIIGAIGNNSVGVAGINWKVKILPVVIAEGSTAEVVESYGYLVKMKKLWLDSAGASGANIVVSNSSFGIDGAKCDSEDYPVWNDLYNQMAQVGILSAAATANNPVDVDQVGDIPTTCTSRGLITITNTDSADALFKYAGFGIKSIMLGAPGTDIYSTTWYSGYQKMTGTSMSTPMVSGAIALMHSAESARLAGLRKSDPEAQAYLMKDLLLGSVDPIPSLKGITVTGGRLNLSKAIQAASSY